MSCESAGGPNFVFAAVSLVLLLVVGWCGMAIMGRLKDREAVREGMGVFMSTKKRFKVMV